MGLVDPNELGSHFDVHEVVVSMTPNWQQALPADPQRVAVLIGSAQGGQGALVTTQPNNGTTAGIPVPATGYMDFVFSRHGPLPAQAWYAQSQAAGAALTFITVSLRRP